MATDSGGMCLLSANRRSNDVRKKVLLYSVGRDAQLVTIVSPVVVFGADVFGGRSGWFGGAAVELSACELQDIIGLSNECLQSYLRQSSQ